VQIRVIVGFAQSYHPLRDCCSQLRRSWFPAAVIAGGNGNIMPRFLPWLQELRSGHGAQLIFLQSSCASVGIRGFYGPCWSLSREFLTGFAAAMFDSPVRFNRREELE
jgi:hypothetical protein